MGKFCNPQPAALCEHDFKWIDPGPLSDDIAVKECKKCGCSEPIAPQTPVVTKEPAPADAEKWDQYMREEGRQMYPKPCGCTEEAACDQCTQPASQPAPAVHKEPFTAEEIARINDVVKEIESRPRWKLGDRPRRYSKPQPEGRQLVNCYDIVEVNAYVDRVEVELAALREKLDRQQAPAVPPVSRFLINFYAGRLVEHPEGTLVRYSDYATLRAQLATKTEECESLYSADKQTQEIIGNYMKEAENAKAQLEQAERKGLLLRDLEFAGPNGTCLKCKQRPHKEICEFRALAKPTAISENRSVQ